MGSNKQLKDFKINQWNSKEWYTIRSLLGCDWANWFVIIGSRERGKSFSVQEYCLQQYFDEKSPLHGVPFYWMRLNDIAIENMKMNNGAKMFEPTLVWSYNLYDIKVKGDSVFYQDKLMTRIYGLSTAYNNKGAALFDKRNFKGCNIIIDEIALEKGQKRTFDIVYNLKMQIENICRSERKNVRVFMILNNTQECPAVLSMFNFIPIEFGRYKLKKKHCVIDYVANNAAYELRRKKALANELDTGTGNFTNKIERDLTHLYKGRLTYPQNIIKFTKDPSEWYTIYSGNVICPYKGEKKEAIAMRRHIEDVYLTERVAQVFELYDVQAFMYKDLFTQIRFQQDMALLKSK